MEEPQKLENYAGKGVWGARCARSSVDNSCLLRTVKRDCRNRVIREVDNVTKLGHTGKYGHIGLGYFHVAANNIASMFIRSFTRSWPSGVVFIIDMSEANPITEAPVLIPGDDSSRSANICL